MSLSQGFARAIKSEVTMGKIQTKPGIMRQATEENSSKKTQKTQKKEPRMDTNLRES
jgi:hypothetical protein